jgi:hypothetical protein
MTLQQDRLRILKAKIIRVAQSSFRQKVQGETKPGELPLSTSSIQPNDQKEINSITGVKSKIPKPSRATDAHHIFSVEAQPKLRKKKK